MSVENNRKPLVDENLYKEIWQKFALPKNEQGKLKYIGLYESHEPVLAGRFKALANSVANGYETDFLKMGLTNDQAKKIAKAVAKEIYAIGWYGYMFCDRARDISWERDMRAAWERDYQGEWDPSKDKDDPDSEGVS